MGSWNWVPFTGNILMEGPNLIINIKMTYIYLHLDGIYIFLNVFK